MSLWMPLSMNDHPASSAIGLLSAMANVVVGSWFVCVVDVVVVFVVLLLFFALGATVERREGEAGVGLKERETESSLLLLLLEERQRVPEKARVEERALLLLSRKL